MSDFPYVVILSTENHQEYFRTLEAAERYLQSVSFEGTAYIAKIVAKAARSITFEKFE